MVFQSLSIRTLCAIAGISRQRIFREIASGRLKACKVGSRTVICSEDLVDWLKKNDSFGNTIIATEPGGNRMGSMLTDLLNLEPSQSNLRLAYSVSEFASLTSLSGNTVRNEIKAGRLHAVRIANDRLIIPATAVEEWFQNISGKNARMR